MTKLMDEKKKKKLDGVLVHIFQEIYKLVIYICRDLTVEVMGDY